MARVDWVPAMGWGDILNVGAGTTLHQPLMDLVRYTQSVNFEGVIEDDTGRFFVERIVGQYTMYRDDAASVPYAIERIWPGLSFTTGPTVQVQGTIVGVQGANTRFWYEKVSFPIEQEAWEDSDIVAHPFWRHIDIRPRQVCDEGMLPVWSIFNADPALSLRVIHRLRLLLKPLK